MTLSNLGACLLSMGRLEQAEQAMREAVAVRDEMNASVLLEASGGLTLDTARAVAETGVDVISVGALTHSAPVLDIGLDAV